MALSELRVITDLGAGGLDMHHTRRAGGTRGSDALRALPDILLDLHNPRGDPFTRRRRLTGIGRYPDVPQQLLVEMNAAATDYALLGDFELDAAAFAPVVETLRKVLGQAAAPLSGRQIHEGWPVAHSRPTLHT